MIFFKSVKFASLIVVLITSVLGCSSFSKHNSNVIGNIPVAVELQKFSFKGKGSSAGIMLMSAMGPAGNAVGIAIDEGISKEITETALKGSADIDQFSLLLTSYVHQALNNSALTIKNKNESLFGFILSSKEAVRIKIKESGFTIVKGSQEQVMAQINAELMVVNHTIPITFPNSTIDPELIPNAELEHIKKNKTVARELWVASFQLLLASELDRSVTQ